MTQLTCDPRDYPSPLLSGAQAAESQVPSPAGARGVRWAMLTGPGGLKAHPRAGGDGRGPEGQPRSPSRAEQRVGGGVWEDFPGRPRRGYCERGSLKTLHTHLGRRSLSLGRVLGPGSAISPAAQRLRSHRVLRFRAAGGWGQEPLPQPWSPTPHLYMDSFLGVVMAPKSPRLRLEPCPVGTWAEVAQGTGAWLRSQLGPEADFQPGRSR